MREDRAALARPLLGVLGVAIEQDEIDDERVAAIGFCFGGQNALDLARAGAEIAGVASFHGLFDPPGLPPRPITRQGRGLSWLGRSARSAAAVVALAGELTAAGATGRSTPSAMSATASPTRGRPGDAGDQV